MIGLTAACALVVAFSAELLFIPVLILLFDVIFVVSKNFLDALLPILLLNALALHTGTMEVALFPYAWLAIPTVIALVLHFLLYPVRIQIGKSFWGLVAVSVALLLGGIGSISAKDYFAIGALYFVIFLGVGMTVFYLAMRVYNFSDERYDAKERLMEILYCLGLFCAFFMVEQGVRMLLCYGKLGAYVGANDICVFVLFSLPAFFYFARRHYVHFYIGAFLVGCMVLTYSITGVFVGGILAVVGLFYLWFYAPNRRLITGINAAIAVIGVTVIVWHFELYDAEKLKAVFFAEENGRVQLLRTAWQGFLKNPVFGSGLGNLEGYDASLITGLSIPWTHNFLVQTIGTMGIIGALAYGFQMVVRARLALVRRTPFRMAIGASYLGIFLISMFQPGEFCPMPYQMMAVLFFVFLEMTERDDTIPTVSYEKTIFPLDKS